MKSIDLWLTYRRPKEWDNLLSYIGSCKGRKKPLICLSSKFDIFDAWVSLHIQMNIEDKLKYIITNMSMSIHLANSSSPGILWVKKKKSCSFFKSWQVLMSRPEYISLHFTVTHKSLKKNCNLHILWKLI